MTHGRETQLLAQAYESLGYTSGVLLDAVEQPEDAPGIAEYWPDLGDWVRLGARVGAEKIFFVNSDPVILFQQSPGPIDRAGFREVYRKAWSMAGPRCLFLASPTELRVYALNRPPARWSDDAPQIQPLAIVERAADVADQLQAFARDQVESGALFADAEFGDGGASADRRLVEDLRVVRRALLDTGLAEQYTHALIARSVFIRYLEDRGILRDEYLTEIAQRSPRWNQLLQQSPQQLDLGPTAQSRRYDRVLRDRDFTYALFDKLSSDFQGDLLPKEELMQEYGAVTQAQLDLLRQFILGESDPNQPQLFIWAYDFRVIPISLISSIYEEFYRTGEDGDESTHYTPSTLVDYVLSNVLTPARLRERPRVLDAACGSGIFLVEAFRRIVRFETRLQGRLSFDDLKRILQQQIVGIELHSEAVRVAALSLQLAVLNFLEPEQILAGLPLPSVLASGGPNDSQFPVLFQGNAFDLTADEGHELSNRLGAARRFRGATRIRQLLGQANPLPLERASCDVIVGNPPWLEAGEATQSGDRSRQAALAARQAVQWALAFEYPVGDLSYPQLFIYRALSLVRQTGTVGLLVSAAVIWNERTTSREFRMRWLADAHMRELVNFSHARRVFFDSATAPFVFARFEPRSGSDPDGYMSYASARLTRAAQQLRTVTFSHIDRHFIPQSELRIDDRLWKVYWWGGHHDAALIGRLSLEASLHSWLSVADPPPGYGFQLGAAGDPGKEPSPMLQALPQLLSRKIRWYGPLRDDWFVGPPSVRVKRQPDESLYQGQRLLVSRGVKTGFGPAARLENQPFSFRHTIYCFPMWSVPEWRARLALGILWSTLGRYWMFMTSGRWGGWHDEVTSQDILQVPMPRSTQEQDDDTRRVLKAVDALRGWNSQGESGTLLDSEAGPPPPESLKQELNSAVFDMFDLSMPERDLVSDFFEGSFDLLTHGVDSEATDPVANIIEQKFGTEGELDSIPIQRGLHSYLAAFLRAWNRKLGPTGELRWYLIRPSRLSLLAVVFETSNRAQTRPRHSEALDERAWALALRRCEETLRQPLSERVYTDMVVRAVSETSIVVIKRNERRLWTASAAREDAEATMVQAMELQRDAAVA